MDFCYSIPGFATFGAIAGLIAWPVTKSLRKAAITFVLATAIAAIGTYFLFTGECPDLCG